MMPAFDRFADQSMLTLTADAVRYDLAESVGPDLSLSNALGGVDLSVLNELSLEYRPAQGSVELRQLIAQHHNVNAENVVTTSGGMHAIFLCSAVLCNSDCHVLVQQPSFPLTQSALALNGAKVEFLPCQFEERYRLNIPDFEARLTPQTSMVCLATPQNPSGVALSLVEIKTILDAMQRKCPNAFLLLDETYRQAGYAGTSAIESFASIDQRIITCSSLSKCHGAPGLRVGWAITSHEGLRQQLINGKFQSIICCSGLDEAVALLVLKQSQQLFDDRGKHLLEGRELVASWVDKHSKDVSWIPPDAGALCCVRLDAASSEPQIAQRFYQALLQHSVRVAPGAWFGDRPEIFRLGFGLLPIPELTEALEVMSDVVAKLR